MDLLGGHVGGGVVAQHMSVVVFTVGQFPHAVFGFCTFLLVFEHCDQFIEGRFHRGQQCFFSGLDQLGFHCVVNF